MSLTNVTLMTLAAIAAGIIMLTRSNDKVHLQIKLLRKVVDLADMKTSSISYLCLYRQMKDCNLHLLHLRLTLTLAALLWQKQLRQQGASFLITSRGHRRLITAKQRPPWVESSCGK